MRRDRGATERIAASESTRTGVARWLFMSRYAMLILLVLYREGVVSTSDLRRLVGGHPAVVVHTLKMLEGLGFVERPRSRRGRRACQNQLTALGRRLMNLPLSSWPSLLYS